MVQGPMAMGEPNFGLIGDESTDDLPRTFRREKEARAREARERAAQERAAAPSLPTGLSSATPDVRPPLQPQMTAASDDQPMIADMPYPATVRRFDVPFFHLMRFFLKAVVAAIPALILLSVILWLFGHALQAFFPDLVKLKILIGFQG